MTKPNIAFISATWHTDVTQNARDAFGEAIGTSALITDHVVPGALEMPLKAQTLARTGEFSAIVCCGLVVDGGIYRHDFVAQAVLDGIMRVNLDEGVPVLSVVLTPHNYHDTKDLRNFFKKHFKIKGEEAAEAVRSLLNLPAAVKAPAEKKPNAPKK